MSAQRSIACLLGQIITINLGGLRTAALYRAPDTPWLHHVNEPGDGPER